MLIFSSRSGIDRMTRVAYFERENGLPIEWLWRLPGGSRLEFSRRGSVNNLCFHLEID